MDQKICKICGEKFTIIDNGWTRKYCYNCSPHEDENITHAQAVTIKRKAMKQALVNLKGGKCSICGYDKSLRALQFHHLDPNEKEFAITKNIKDFDKLKAEIEKCILVCSNCHAEIHEQLDNVGLNLD